MSSINADDRMGTMCWPWGKYWHSSHEDALVPIHYNDNLFLEMEHVIQTMEGDSVIPPINANQLSLEGSSHWVVNATDNSARMRTTTEDDDWGHLNDVKIPGKTWDYVGSPRRRMFSNNDDNASDEESTMSRQGEE